MYKHWWFSISNDSTVKSFEGSGIRNHDNAHLIIIVYRASMVIKTIGRIGMGVVPVLPKIDENIMNKFVREFRPSHKISGEVISFKV